MKVSVVTINFNQGHFLADALEAIQAQTYTNWEHIIVDPGSSDGSALLYDQLVADDRYVVIKEPDEGPADGLNKGFSRATGDILYYLNADDRVLPHAFSRAVKHLQDLQVGCVIAHGHEIDATGRRTRELLSFWSGAKPYLLGANVTVQQSTFFTKDAFLASGGFEASNRVSWDGELLVRMAAAGVQIRVVDDHWGEFRRYEETITSGLDYRQHLLAQRGRMYETYMGRTIPPPFLAQFLRLTHRTSNYLRNPRLIRRAIANRRARARK